MKIFIYKYFGVSMAATGDTMKKLLLIEDDQDTFRLMTMLLKGIGYSEETIIGCGDMRAINDLDTQDIEIVLTDLSLPDSESGETFARVQERFPYTPIIVMTATSEIATAVKTIQQGAQDYLVKGEFDKKLLTKAIQYAIERKKQMNDYRRLFEENPAPMFIYNYDTYRFLTVNAAALHQYGYGRGEFLSMSADQIRPQEDIPAFLHRNPLTPYAYSDLGRWRHKRKSGEVFFVHVYAHRIIFEGSKAMMIHAVDIDKKVKAELAVEEKTRQVESQNEQLRKIAWIQSHEVRGPVANIMGLVQLFNMNDPADPYNGQILESLRIVSEKLDGIIKKITAHTNEMEL